MNSISSPFIPLENPAGKVSLPVKRSNLSPKAAADRFLPRFSGQPLGTSVDTFAAQRQVAANQRQISEIKTALTAALERIDVEQWNTLKAKLDQLQPEGQLRIVLSPETKLRYKNLSGINWSRVCFVSPRINPQTSERDNVQLDIELANLCRANLSGATLKKAKMGGVALEKATLCGADLQGATLDGSYLVHANLQGANLQGANLGSAKLDHAILRQANLANASLTSATLSWANLAGAQAPEANFSFTQLRETNFFHVNLYGTLFNDASLYQTDFSYSDLSHADFSSAHGRDTYFYFANLTNANLQNANLTGADFLWQTSPMPPSPGQLSVRQS